MISDFKFRKQFFEFFFSNSWAFAEGGGPLPDYHQRVLEVICHHSFSVRTKYTKKYFQQKNNNNNFVENIPWFRRVGSKGLFDLGFERRFWVSSLVLNASV